MGKKYTIKYCNGFYFSEFTNINIKLSLNIILPHPEPTKILIETKIHSHKSDKATQPSSLT